MGWNGSDGVTNQRKGNKAAHRPSFWRGLIAAFIVVCCAVACCWFFLRDADGFLPKKAKPKKTARIAVMDPDLRHAEEAQSLADRQNHATAPVKPAVDPNFPYTDGRKVVRSTTNSWGQVIDRCIMPNGKRRKVIRNLRKPIFNHVTDDVLLMALVGGGDEPGPPIPFDENMEEAFLASLNDPIVISKDDSDEVIKAKMLVMEGRRNMAELIAQGETFFDALPVSLGAARPFPRPGFAGVACSGC